MSNEITDTSKKFPNLEKLMGGKIISQKLRIHARVKYLARTTAYVTLKNHKESFLSKSTCHLLNPAKSGIGKRSKNIIEKINASLREKLLYQKLKNTNIVKKQFEGVGKKGNCKLYSPISRIFIQVLQII